MEKVVLENNHLPSRRRDLHSLSRRVRHGVEIHRLAALELYPSTVVQIHQHGEERPLVQPHKRGGVKVWQKPVVVSRVVSQHPQARVQSKRRAAPRSLHKVADVRHDLPLEPSPQSLNGGSVLEHGQFVRVGILQQDGVGGPVGGRVGRLRDVPESPVQGRSHLDQAVALVPGQEILDDERRALLRGVKVPRASGGDVYASSHRRRSLLLGRGSGGNSAIVGLVVFGVGHLEPCALLRRKSQHFQEAFVGVNGIVFVFRSSVCRSRRACWVRNFVNQTLRRMRKRLHCSALPRVEYDRRY
mmetsp:Transcript_17554/g.51203  ORF Transcript_17554/g.51203 Transcript_17554/m.51203 type:complete len:300 (+) Transcript_17554:800-1699(+)